MKISKNAAILLSFSLWFCIGTMLLYKGMNYLYESMMYQTVTRSEQPILGFFSHLLGSTDYALLGIVFVSAFFGYVKGYVALRKAADRMITRIAPYGGKVPLEVVFPKWYIGLIGGMMLLGMGVKYLPLTSDLRGMVDTAVGFALLNGSTFFLKHLLQRRVKA